MGEGGREEGSNPDINEPLQPPLGVIQESCCRGGRWAGIGKVVRAAQEEAKSLAPCRVNRVAGAKQVLHPRVITLTLKAQLLSNDAGGTPRLREKVKPEGGCLPGALASPGRLAVCPPCRLESPLPDPPALPLARLQAMGSG